MKSNAVKIFKRHFEQVTDASIKSIKYFENERINN